MDGLGDPVRGVVEIVQLNPTDLSAQVVVVSGDFASFVQVLESVANELFRRPVIRRSVNCVDIVLERRVQKILDLHRVWVVIVLGVEGCTAQNERRDILQLARDFWDGH
ncbi:hypothetical protein OGAPHI_007397 [Ogataea philodendri]|uniref:Uncharacterized protein n=1 Tax=Ogataea philodendri TaxID=1378263 RepID=A0A9P8NVY3_9ASCO|nr:uncharacterized protein OGAPHI_007397 [Ogataea philodendri]KAH3660192.1 hypothetical protein OGAPHI_007397 [Ogataea philodendri]